MGLQEKYYNNMKLSVAKFIEINEAYNLILHEDEKELLRSTLEYYQI